MPVAYAVAFVFSLMFIPFLRSIKAGQPIKKIGPVWHMHKEGTPTMGGWIFIVGLTAGIAYACVRRNADLALSGALLAFALVYGLIGFVDDSQKIKKRDNDGLSASQKLALQLAASLAFIFLLRYLGYLHPQIFVPFAKVKLQVNMVVYEVFAAFVIVGAVNAVNITDGVDGVLTGVSLPVVGCLTLLALNRGVGTVAAYGFALMGGLLAFLCFNFNPAKIFMGDTGSLFIGGAICAMAFALDVPLTLAPMCLIFVFEVVSDFIQVGYFKYSRRKYGEGRRVFKMAPFHHHLEKSGWSEKRIFVVFTAVSVVCSVAAYFGSV
jgi:phospho-N-acetylmuramoyl-pentapeptide-transferase